MRRDGQAPVIGYDELRGRPNYSTARNCYAPVPGVDHVRVSRLPIDAITRHGGIGDASFVPARPSAVDVLHLWNKVSLGRQPWGVSMESVLPRLLRGGQRSPSMRVLRSRVLDDRCRFLAPISDWARELFLNTFNDRELAVVEPKTHRVYPFQAVDSHVPPLVPPADDEPLRIGFVGGDFFRKGGEALLAVADRWGDELDLRFEIVSSCSRTDYATTWLTSAHVDRTRARLAAHPRIDWFPSLANAEVLELMSRTHVGMLPTMAETFGYSLLEFMSRGRPVIGTNVQAGAEILAPDRSWMLELELRPDRLWRGRSGADFAYGLGVLELTEQLGGVLRQIRSDPAALATKGATARAHVATRYCHERTAQMSRIYAAAVA
jgi:glycosyltransferase involved in cell wall biosynthesis